MKTILRFSVFGLVTAAFMAVSAVSTFAQNPCDDTFETKQAFYGTFREGRKEPRNITKAEAGIKAGDEFLSKYSTCEADKEVVTFVKDKLPELKDWVKLQKLYTRFNSSIADIKTVNASEAYSSGKEIMSIKPDLAFDISIVLAQVGYDSSVKNPPVDTFTGEAIGYGKKAIKDIEGGKTSPGFGAKVYSLGDKEKALGWLNYMVGSMLYYNQKATKEAVPFFYQATKYNAPPKTKPDVYRAIGAWYLEEILKMDAKRLEIIKANADKDNEESLTMLALEKGYADRAFDAYARAYKLAPAADADYKKGLKEKLDALYKIRFDKTDGVEGHIATVTTKPMPDPAAPVEPIKEATPATTTTTTTSTTTTVPNTSTTSTTTKPGTTTTKPAADTTKPTTDTTKPAADTTKPSTTEKPATTTKPTTSKTTTKSKTTKKKGTR